LSDDPKPLKQRGWALQENLLAPRRLTYHHNSLSIECQSVLERFDFLSSARTITSLSKTESYSTWNEIVREYTRRRLTREEDILPALSGLAREFQKVNRDTYLAGIWREQLLPGLLWSRIDGDSQPLPCVYRAPSWSWAAHKCRASYLVGNKGVKEEYLAEILAAETVRKGSDVFGEVSNGRIVIKGFIREGTLYRRLQTEEFLDLQDEEDSWAFRAAPLPLHNPKGLSGGARLTTDDSGLVGTKEEVFANVFLDDSVPELVEVIQSAFLFLIRADEQWDGICDDRGVVLTATNTKKFEYRRTGTFIMLTRDRQQCFGTTTSIVTLI
jgi:hypothetical protein